MKHALFGMLYVKSSTKPGSEIQKLFGGNIDKKKTKPHFAEYTQGIILPNLPIVRKIIPYRHPAAVSI
jgi:hypothetical protein